MKAIDSYSVMLPSGYKLILKMVDIDKGVGIALLNTVDEPFQKIDAILDDLAMAASGHTPWPDAIVGIPEQGILLAHGVARALGHRRAYILRKTSKAFDDAYGVLYTSITKKEPQKLYMPKAWAKDLAGKHVLIVEDVINTGATVKAALDIMKMASVDAKTGIEVVGVLVVLTEGHAWKKALGGAACLVQGLAHIPMFRPVAYAPICETR